MANAPGSPRPIELQPRSGPRRRNPWRYGGAAALAAVAAAAIWMSQRTTAPAAVASWPARGPAPGIETVVAPRADSSLYRPTPSAPGADAPMTLDEFIDTLAASAPEPTAKSVAKAFLAEPALRQTWESFHPAPGSPGRAGGMKPLAAEFLGELTRRAEFRQLVARFKSEPGFQAAWTRVQSDRRAGPIIHAALEAARAQGARAAGSILASKPVASAGSATYGAAAARHDAPSTPAGASSGEQGAAANKTDIKSGPEAHDVSTKLDQSWRKSGGATKDVGPPAGTRPVAPEVDRSGKTVYHCIVGRGYHNDGRCYADKAGVTCCVMKNGYRRSAGGQVCDADATPWLSEPCECAEGAPIANTSQPFCP